MTQGASFGGEDGSENLVFGRVPESDGPGCDGPAGALPRRDEPSAVRSASEKDIRGSGCLEGR